MTLLYSMPVLVILEEVAEEPSTVGCCCFFIAILLFPFIFAIIIGVPVDSLVSGLPSPLDTILSPLVPLIEDFIYN